jgi:hypothetical protein
MATNDIVSSMTHHTELTAEQPEQALSVVRTPSIDPAVITAELMRRAGAVQEQIAALQRAGHVSQKTMQMVITI